MRPPGHSGGRELGVALEAIAFSFGHVDGSAGRLGEVGDAANVVEMPVRDQDGGAGRAEPAELNAELRRLAARVDDDAG